MIDSTSEHLSVKYQVIEPGCVYVCGFDECDDTFASIHGLMTHVNDDHYNGQSLPQIFVCRHCNKMIPNSGPVLFRNSITSHMRHHDDLMYECVWCLDAFPKDEFLVLNHHVTKHQDDPILYRSFQRHPDRADIVTFNEVKFQLKNEGDPIFETPSEVMNFVVQNESPFINNVKILKEDHLYYGDCLRYTEYIDSSKHFRTLIECKICVSDQYLTHDEFVGHLNAKHSEIEREPNESISRFGLIKIRFLCDSLLSFLSSN